tara:strand:- start:572 stop:994 length:423 start_codon:yes stop_codon:yes gene_type:complete
MVTIRPHVTLWDHHRLEKPEFPKGSRVLELGPKKGCSSERMSKGIDRSISNCPHCLPNLSNEERAVHIQRRFQHSGCPVSSEVQPKASAVRLKVGDSSSPHPSIKAIAVGHQEWGSISAQIVKYTMLAISAIKDQHHHGE